MGCSIRAEYQLSVTFTSLPSPAGSAPVTLPRRGSGDDFESGAVGRSAFRHVARPVLCQPDRTAAPMGGNHRGARGRGPDVLARGPPALPRETTPLPGRVRPDAQRVEV